jgi:hypothetical protein
MLGLREEFPGPKGAFSHIPKHQRPSTGPTVTRTANATAAEEVIHSVSRRIFAASCTEKGACTNTVFFFFFRPVACHMTASVSIHVRMCFESYNMLVCTVPNKQKKIPAKIEKKKIGCQISRALVGVCCSFLFLACRIRGKKKRPFDSQRWESRLSIPSSANELMQPPFLLL